MDNKPVAVKRPKNISKMTLSEVEAAGLTDELKKGERFRSRGRPRKPLDTRQQFSLSYWFRLIEGDIKKLRPKDRARIALECWKTLISKANNVPNDPDDSKTNAEEAFNLLKSIESPTDIIQPTIQNNLTNQSVSVNSQNK